MVGDFVVGVSGGGKAGAGVTIHLGGRFFGGEVFELASIMLFPKDGAGFDR